MAQADNSRPREEAVPSPQRRRFLIVAGAALGALAIPFVRHSEAEFIGSMLRDKLPDLRMESDQLSRFSGDFVDYYQSRRQNPYRRRVFIWGIKTLRAYLSGSGERIIISAFFAEERGRLEKELFTAFFLGTNYFEARQSPASTVRYLNMPDPYKSGCPNTLARFD